MKADKVKQFNFLKKSQGKSFKSPLSELCNLNPVKRPKMIKFF